MAKEPKNLAASVRQRLLNLARQEERLFNVVLVAYGLERVIHRLSISKHADKFILKGGMLATLWTIDHGRFTRDVDFLGFGASDSDSLNATFTEVLAADAHDGLTFDAAVFRRRPSAKIRSMEAFGSRRSPTSERRRFRLRSMSASATQSPTRATRSNTPPCLISRPQKYAPNPLPRSSPKKFQAVVALGLINGRMKDFYDLWAIPQNTEFDDSDLDAAIKATFERRETSVPRERPDGMTDAFAKQKSAQWRAYAQSISLEGVELKAVVADIWSRLEPSCRRLTKDGGG